MEVRKPSALQFAVLEMLLLAIFLSVESKNDEYAIFNHVFENYNPEVRPSTVNEVIKVKRPKRGVDESW